VLSREGDINLGLFDVNMPILNGEELGCRFAAEPKTAGLPVVMVSTEGSIERIERWKKLGAAFIRKPFGHRGAARRDHQRNRRSLMNPKWTAALRGKPVREVLRELVLHAADSSAYVAAARSAPAISARDLGGGFQRRGARRAAPHAARFDDRARGGPRCWVTHGPLELSEQYDAVCELANIVCGNVLPLIAGERAVFDLASPRVIATMDANLGDIFNASARVLSTTAWFVGLDQSGWP